MFASHEVRLDMTFARARARLAVLYDAAGWLCGPSEQAYAEGLAGLTRVGPPGAVPSASRLVRVQLLEPVPRDDMVVLPLRWEASGAAGRLFPVLDANLVLTPAGEGAATLTLTGAYRPPPGSPGEVFDPALLNRAAAATVRSLLARLADSMMAGEAAAGEGAAVLEAADGGCRPCAGAPGRRLPDLA
jgi:hypothetical protein